MIGRKPLTGPKVLAIAVAFFGTIFAVNFFMAWSAISTFPGLEVRNSYIASQGFNARLAEQRELGWELQAGLDGNQLRLDFTDAASGAPVPVGEFFARVERPTHDRDDLTPEFTRRGSTFYASVDLAPGAWYVRVTATAPDGREFIQRVPLQVRS